jgi:hypothetical protein
LPIVFVATVLLLIVVAAMQLRHDGQLDDEHFSALIVAAIKALPQLFHGRAARAEQVAGSEPPGREPPAPA